MDEAHVEIPKCYNSLSCVLSVLVIVFILGSIIWDIFFTRPEIKDSLTDIKKELVQLGNKIDSEQQTTRELDSLYYEIENKSKMNY